ncbi:MAG: hypothetical protein HY934_09135 [Candidatus Firestonebacteria bacterium]|nr:hypothetical protein [Candidatus Firestonebacteria bacterium]
MTQINYSDNDILRYCRQIVMKAMDKVRTEMRGSTRLSMKQSIENIWTEKSELNQTKAIDKETEDLMLASLCKKFKKIKEVKSFIVFSEELGIKSFPEGTKDSDADLVIFIDPVDGTEFAENLQGGWCLMAVYDIKNNEVIAAVAGDIFLDRLYWASKSSDAEGLDFITHSWFKLDGGPNPRNDLSSARVNFLTTKVSRYLSVAKQKALLDAIEKNDGRINLAWGSNMIIQVAAGYADVAVEFTKGFATYDVLPGLFLAQKAGLTVLDLKGNPIENKLDINEIFSRYRQDPKNPSRIKFVVSKSPELAHQVIELINL